MHSLSHDDLDRLGRIAGMFGSDHDGERAAAARKADQLLRALGTDWKALTDALKAVSVKTPASLEARRPVPAYPCTSHQIAARKLLSAGRLLSEWEAEFLTSILLRRSLSERQAATLTSIKERVERRKRRAA